MIFWIIQIVLAILIALTIVITVVSIVKEKKDFKKYEVEEKYGAKDEEKYSERPIRRSKNQAPSQRRREPVQKKVVAEQQRNNAGNKRRWKVILQNLDTEERHSFVFLDTIGMGRTTQEAAYEDFLSLPNDRKISKVHCAIVRNNDKLFIRDEGSKNYTFLNGKKVTKPVILQKEDVISLGETDLEVIKILREASK